MPTYPNVTVDQMELTPCIVKFKKPGDLTYTDLGGTLDNVKVAVQYMKSPIKADQFGQTDLNSKVSGFACTVETAIAEVKDLELLKVIFPHATIVGTSPNFALDFKTQIGDDDLTNAGELLLHPQSAGDTDESHDFLFFKATATAQSEYVFSPTEQTKMKIVWKIYPDTSVTPAKFLRYGDKDIV